MKIIIKEKENPIEKIVDAFVIYGRDNEHKGTGNAYVVKREDCIKACEIALRHFILNHGHDDLLPTPENMNPLIENYLNGHMNFFEGDYYIMPKKKLNSKP